MFSGSFFASAQGGQGTSAPASATMSPAGGISVGQDGYRISGEANPNEPGQKYTYTREMPDGSAGVYWHVEGAIAIDGNPAATYPTGSLDATERAELTIVWDFTGKDSIVLQLRRDNPESKTGVDVMADFFGFRLASGGHINYYGPTPPCGFQLTASGSHADQFLCPPGPSPVYNQPAPTVTVNTFDFDSPNCDYFIWTLKYNTANGTYQEQWGTSLSRTGGNNFALYSRAWGH